MYYKCCVNLSKYYTCITQKIFFKIANFSTHTHNTLCTVQWACVLLSKTRWTAVYMWAQVMPTFLLIYSCITFNDDDDDVVMSNLFQCMLYAFKSTFYDVSYYRLRC